MDTRRAKQKQYPTGVRPHGAGIEIWFIWPAGSGQKTYEKLDWNCTAANLASAGRLRQEITEKIRHNAFNYADYFPNSPRATTQQRDTFHAYAQRWLDSPENDWKPQSRYKFRSMLQRVWMPALHDKMIHLITKSDMLDALTAACTEFVAENERQPSQSLYNDWLSCARGPFRHAVESGAIKPADNPADLLRNKTRVKSEPDPLTEAERDAIIADIYHHDGPIWGAWFQLGFFTGMRYHSEPAALTWQDINLAATHQSPYGEIRIDKIRCAHAKGGIQKSTKTRTARTVLLNSQAHSALLVVRKHTGLQDNYVFLQKNGPVITGEPQRAMWRASLKRLKIRHRDPYSMRHTYATWGLMNGNNPAFMARQLGHSLQEFFNTYAKWIDLADNRLQMELMERAISQNVAGVGQKKAADS